MFVVGPIRVGDDASPTTRTVAQLTAAQALAWIAAGRRLVAALLVDVEGSAPFDSGATMYVDDRFRIEGSITGGCVEGAVALEARDILDNGTPARLVTYGVTDEIAGTVGLTCGGTVHVLIHELREEDHPATVAALEAFVEERPAGLVTLVDGECSGKRMFVDAASVIGTLGRGELLDYNAAREARGMLAQGRTGVRSFGADGASLGSHVRVHVASFAPRPQLVLFGANDFSAAIASLANWFGYRVTIVDPRGAFLASERFSRSATTMAVWPDIALGQLELSECDAIVACTHDPKLDVPALVGALRTSAGYVGALGSRRTTSERALRLRAAGVTVEEVEGLHAPSGLDIGAATAEETALAVLGEIVACRSGRAGGYLQLAEGPIRHDREAAFVL